MDLVTFYKVKIADKPKGKFIFIKVLHLYIENFSPLRL